ncbi:MAG: hypothetical protein ACQEP0_09540 [Natrinema limicola]
MGRIQETPPIAPEPIQMSIKLAAATVGRKRFRHVRTAAWE